MVYMEILYVSPLYDCCLNVVFVSQIVLILVAMSPQLYYFPCLPCVPLSWTIESTLVRFKPGEWSPPGDHRGLSLGWN